MFNLQGSEIIVILLVALVVLGPEKLPEAVRRASRTYHELKKMGTGFQAELKAAIDEPMREMRETADLVRDAADPRKFAGREPRPAGESRPAPTPADAELSPAGVEPDGDDTVMGEMREDDPALDPGSTTVGTPRHSLAADPSDAEPDVSAVVPDSDGAGQDADVDGADPVAGEGSAPDTNDRPAR